MHTYILTYMYVCVGGWVGGWVCIVCVCVCRAHVLPSLRTTKSSTWAGKKKTVKIFLDVEDHKKFNLGKQNFSKVSALVPELYDARHS
jgi:hypothetical protein